MFDRHIEGQNSKCQQKVLIPSGVVLFPSLVDGTGNIDFQPYRLAAVTFHLGTSQTADITEQHCDIRGSGSSMMTTNSQTLLWNFQISRTTL